MFANISHQPPEELTSVFSPWPFAQWEMDIIGPLPSAHAQMKYAIVVIDYLLSEWK